VGTIGNHGTEQTGTDDEVVVFFQLRIQSSNFSLIQN
jgi:hypothetical protein